MRSDPGVLLALVLLTGCHGGSARDVPASKAAPAPSSAPVAAKAEANDFEDLFAYDAGDYDAGDVAAALLHPKPGFDAYTNARFGFSLDVARAFTAMPEPTNGDGRIWRLGKLAAIAASAGYRMDAPITCASSSHVTAHTQSKNGCWATGIKDGFVHWERQVAKDDVLYSLRFQYVASLKAEMDPIVTRMNASWSVPGG